MVLRMNDQKIIQVNYWKELRKEINKTIGGYDLEILLFSTNFEHFLSMVSEIREKFSKDIMDHDFLFMKKIHKYYSLPKKKINDK